LISTASQPGTTTLNTQGLLMEGLRLLDEAQRDAAAKVKMSSSTPDPPTSSSSSPSSNPMTAAVLTISDSCSRGEKQDLSGPCRS